MRKMAALLSMLAALSATAAETWRWRDADGVVHYSDRPVPGAERIDVRASQPSAVSPPPPPPQQAVGLNPNAPVEQQAVRYTSCTISSPVHDTVYNGVTSVSVAIDLQPSLQQGHRLQVYLNGQLYTAWPEGALSYTLQNVFRGSYTLSARVVDAGGRGLCAGPSITFHVRQPSLLAPARPPAAGP